MPTTAFISSAPSWARNIDRNTSRTIPATEAGTERPGRREPDGGPVVDSASPAGKAARRGCGDRRPRRQAAAGQPVPEPLPPPRQPALDRPDGAAEVPRRLLVRAAFQVAEHHRDAIPLGQPVHLLVDDGREVVRVARLARGPIRREDRIPLDDPPAIGVPPGPDRRATGDPVQPGADRVPHPERAAPAGQDQERRLEGVPGVVLVAQDGPAGAQDHRPVPLDQGREGQLGGLAAPRREALQQLPVRQPDPVPARKRVRSPGRTSRSRRDLTKPALSPAPRLLLSGKGAAVADRSNFVHAKSGRGQTPEGRSLHPDRVLEHPQATSVGIELDQATVRQGGVERRVADREHHQHRNFQPPEALAAARDRVPWRRGGRCREAAHDNPGDGVEDPANRSCESIRSTR